MKMRRICARRAPIDISTAISRRAGGSSPVFTFACTAARMVRVKIARIEETLTLVSKTQTLSLGEIVKGDHSVLSKLRKSSRLASPHLTHIGTCQRSPGRWELVRR